MSARVPSQRKLVASLGNPGLLNFRLGRKINFVISMTGFLGNDQDQTVGPGEVELGLGLLLMQMDISLLTIMSLKGVKRFMSNWKMIKNT